MIRRGVFRNRVEDRKTEMGHAREQITAVYPGR
jgi:hypothetical protein